MNKSIAGATFFVIGIVCLFLFQYTQTLKEVVVLSIITTLIFILGLSLIVIDIVINSINKNRQSDNKTEDSENK